MQESNFDRTMYNISKAGAYYTNLWHCGKIANMFMFPENEEVSILDPSAGDGTAVLEVTKHCRNRKIFAVEIMKDVAEKLRDNEEILEVLNSDFLETTISHNVFSFCFSNPPYIEDSEGRMELSFLKKLVDYITDGGILVYVIPYHVAVSPRFGKRYLSQFEPLFEFRFHEKEFGKYKQIVMIGRKRKEKEYIDEAVLEKFCNRKEEDFLLIPEEWTEQRIEVYPSAESRVTQFRSRFFDAEEAFKELISSNPQKKNLKTIAIEQYVEDELPQPPIMPNQNVLYILSTLGCGAGKTGNKEKMDEHLQRGSAKSEVVTYEDIAPDGTVEEVTRKSTKITVTVLEQNGKFTTLE